MRCDLWSICHRGLDVQVLQLERPSFEIQNELWKPASL